MDNAIKTQMQEECTFDGVLRSDDQRSFYVGVRGTQHSCCHCFVSLHSVAFSKASFENDEMVKFYTGLPNLVVLKAVFAFVQKGVPSSELSTNKLSSFQEFVATLVMF